MDGVALRTGLRIAVAEPAEPGHRTVRLVMSGEVDCSSARHLRQAIRRVLTAGATTLVLDLARVSFIDAAGLGVLIGALRELRARDGRLVVLGSQRPVLRVFEITGLLPLLEVGGEPVSTSPQPWRP